MSKLSIKNIEIVSKEIEVPGFEETLTIYPINGFGLMKIKAFMDKLANKQKELEYLEKSNKSLTSSKSIDVTEVEKIKKTNEAILAVQDEITEIQKELCEFCFKEGAKADDETIKVFIDNDFETSLLISTQVIEYSSNFAQERAKHLEFAKKK